MSVEIDALTAKAISSTGSAPPAAPPGGDGATTAGRAAVSRPAVEHSESETQ